MVPNRTYTNLTDQALPKIGNPCRIITKTLQNSRPPREVKFENSQITLLGRIWVQKSVAPSLTMHYKMMYRMGSCGGSVGRAFLKWHRSKMQLNSTQFLVAP